jgi:hypothetical protein
MGACLIVYEPGVTATAFGALHDLCRLVRYGILSVSTQLEHCLLSLREVPSYHRTSCITAPSDESSFYVISDWYVHLGCLLTSEKAIKHKSWRHTGSGDGILVVEWVNAEMWRR